MVERCSRFQCGAPATARVAFDALGCMVWIDRFDAAGPLDVGARGAGALCTRHADRLVPPRGWAVQDRRGPDLQLWSDRPAAPPAPPSEETATSVRRAPASPVAVLEPPLPFDAPPPATVAPEADEPGDLERLLGSPRSPLLARAFNAAHSRQAG